MPDQRQELKNPLGQLIKGSQKETVTILKKLVKTEKPSKIIAVGDVVSKNLLDLNIAVNIIIVDNKVLRQTIKPIKPTTVKAENTLNVKNPSGVLTPEAWTTVEAALKQNRLTRVLVDGEEDLFTLAAVLLAPDNALVVYGQPNEGLVAVKVNSESRRKVKLIVDGMQPLVEKAK